VTGLRRLRDRTPLRVTLVAAVLVLVAMALGVMGIAATASLRGYLIDRIDSQLRAVANGPADRFLHDLAGTPNATGARVPSAYYLQLSDSSGHVIVSQSAALHDESPPRLPILNQAAATRLANQPFTAHAAGDSSHRWRVLVTPLADGSGSITTAVSLDDVDNTVGRLIVIDLLVGLVVLLVLGILGYALVRISLRPLTEVEHTAAAIADGDLSQRVPERDPGTEVGRLGSAVNTMLTQIEAAFRAREESEASARSSEDRMRRFVADASHELRTPLTSIRGFSELYRQGAVTDPVEVARVMGRIESEATRMGILVEDLLLLARMDQQRPLEQETVDLLPLAVETVGDAAAVDPDRPIRLRPDAESVLVLGDEQRLRQVLGNLVNNALVHTPAGTPVTVWVGAEGESAVIEVSDEGPGLTPEAAARVFERFYRTDTARARAHGGVGLGLSIVASLAAAHGGRATVTTTPGEGATFRVVFPLLAVQPSPLPGNSAGVIR
jgi:two-component system OmpR family sensor kinase